ncbi:DUF4175 family protein [Aureispira anguillae]|uniref:DUF4175 domain-containing protein n=1 Tax=Aureispira anguillae TaxID=2864201 RepID=A0A916DUW3_9BACT|nr:DUF4175 family protein [Aureispira anguillae]BDS13731.1 DUF4175 domain-containing protein [Aureispira anguillae]
MQNNNYQSLIEKIDQFTRKYYMNNLIRGSLYSIGGLLAAFISFALLEYYYFNATVSSMELRKGLFYSFLGISALTLGWFVFRPLLQYFKLGDVISHEQAAKIIGQHFGAVKDKLLNVLQLKEQMGYTDSVLVEASINQKIKTLKPVPFAAAIDLKENKRYLRYAIPPLLLLLLLLLTSNILEESTSRIINNNKEFEKAAAFRFIVEDVERKVVQYENYNLEVKIEGEYSLNEVFIEVDNYKYKLEKVDPNTFRYTFVELRKDTEFNLTAHGVVSKKYGIDVLEKPQIADFDIDLKYPSYTGRSNESITGIGDLIVPVGTNIEWLFKSINTNSLNVQFPGEKNRIATTQVGESAFTVKKRILKEGEYKIFIANKELPKGDSISYSLTLIPDMYPSIDVKSNRDSLNDKVVYFVGEASDDYGLKALNFNYKIERAEQAIKEDQLAMSITKGKQTTYDYILNVKELDLKPGDKLSYYFEAFDNDAVNGSKSVKTAVMYYEMPSIEELKEQETTNNAEIKNELEDAIKKMKKLGDDVKRVQNRILQKKDMNWQDRRELEKLIKEREAIEEEIQDAKENFDENVQKQEEYQEVSKEIAEKQEMLQKLFDEVMNDEMKDLFNEMEEMLNEMDQEKLKEQLDEIKMSEEEMEKELDRMLELFKKMEVEKAMEDAVNELDSLAKEQEELSKQTEENANKEDKKGDKENKDGNKEKGDKNKDGKQEEKKMTQEEIEKKQEEINKKFDEVMEKVKEAKEKNEELESPMDMENEEMDQQEKDTKENLQNSSQQLQKKNNKKASKSQKNAAQKMKEMSKEMKEMMQMNQMEQMKEDIKSMRQLLENLVDMSFDQEDLIDEVNITVTNTPTYVKLVQQQDKIKDDFRHIEDSLQALSKRVYQIEAFVTEKVTEVKKTLKKSVKTLEERQKRTAVVQQQYTMTGVNDLALMLNEAMDQMQQQMAQQMPGDQMCEKPGNGKPGGQGNGMGKGGKKPGMGGLRQLQEQLNKQMQQMKEQMKQGKMPGGKQFAQMAAKQAAIRKALQDAKKKGQKKGKGGGKELQDMIDAMDKVETDLVNKRLPNDMQKRQKDILTRLLQAENAERERELDEKRKAERPDEYVPKMPPALEEYLKKRQGQVEMFKTVSPSLKPYYKNLVERYFRALN